MISALKNTALCGGVICDSLIIRSRFEPTLAPNNLARFDDLIRSAVLIALVNALLENDFTAAVGAAMPDDMNRLGAFEDNLDRSGLVGRTGQKCQGVHGGERGGSQNDYAR